MTPAAGPTDDALEELAPQSLEEAMAAFVACGVHDVVATDLVDQRGTRIVSDDACLGIEIPAGATIDWFVLVRYAVPVEQTLPTLEGLEIALPVVQLATADGAGLPVVLARPAHIVLQYADEDLAGLDEGSVSVQLQDPMTGSWNAVPATVDVARNQILLDTPVLGPLAIFAARIPAELGESSVPGSPEGAVPIEPPASIDDQVGEPALGAEGAGEASSTDSPEPTDPTDEAMGNAETIAPTPSADPSGSDPPVDNPDSASPAARVRLAALPVGSDYRADWTGADD